MKNPILLIAAIFFVFNSWTQEQLPPINQHIIDFVNSNINKKVGRGECWDLAQIPLNEANANWDGLNVFGKKKNYKKDVILPGDIIQFENVVLKFEEGNKTWTINLAHHTAIVYEVLGNEVYRIAQQNTEKGKKVTIDNIDFKTMTKGKVQFFRPEK